MPDRPHNHITNNFDFSFGHTRAEVVNREILASVVGSSAPHLRTVPPFELCDEFCVAQAFETVGNVSGPRKLCIAIRGVETCHPGSGQVCLAGAHRAAQQGSLCSGLRISARESLDGLQCGSSGCGVGIADGLGSVVCCLACGLYFTVESQRSSLEGLDMVVTLCPGLERWEILFTGHRFTIWCSRGRGFGCRGRSRFARLISGVRGAGWPFWRCAMRPDRMAGG